MRRWSLRRREPATADGLPLPPASLRSHVAVSDSADRFLEVGRRCRQDLLTALEGASLAPEPGARVLDFGCGPGRTIRWFAADGFELSGSDIDAEAIAWCRANLPFARFEVNGEWPPLPFEEGSFDLVYAISVFTHLDERHAAAWIEELGRVLAPGGTLAATVHGARSYDKVSPELAERVRREGFVYERNDHWKETFPDWYQLALDTREHALATFGETLEVVAYAEGALTDYQDILIARK